MSAYECVVDLVKKCPTKTIVECGVSVGTSLRLIVDNMPEGCHVYGFDSFKGLQDKHWTDSVEEKMTGSFKADEQTVRDKFKDDPVTIITGDIPESLIGIPQIGFLHIDVDYYRVYMDVLNHFYKDVVLGGYIVADDTPSKQFTGSLKAMQEFFEYKEVLYTYPHKNHNQRKTYVIKGHRV